MRIKEKKWEGIITIKWELASGIYKMIKTIQGSEFWSIKIKNWKKETPKKQESKWMHTKEDEEEDEFIKV